MDNFNQETPSRTHSPFVRPSRPAPLELIRAPEDWEPENLLKSEDHLDITKFYVKALLLQEKAQQQEAPDVSFTGSSELPDMRTADKEIKQLVYSFSLLTSRSRPDHSGGRNISAGGEITACVLREKPSDDGTGQDYILYAAKNKGFDWNAQFYMLCLEEWVQGDSDPKADFYTSVLDHLSLRIRSYLNSFSQTQEYPQIPPTWPARDQVAAKKLVIFHRDLKRDGIRRAQTEPREPLQKAADFVTDNRERTQTMMCDHPDSGFNNIWDQVERLSRIPLAFKCLGAFRQKVINTESGFELIRVSPDRTDSLAEYVELFSKDVKYEDMKNKAKRYARTISLVKKQFLELEDINNVVLHSSPNHVHCEVHLLEHLLITEHAQHLKEVYDYIGCSREPCWLCHLVVRAATKFKMAQSHAGVYWNWTMSKALAEFPGIPDALKEADGRMLDIIRNTRSVEIYIHTSYPSYRATLQPTGIRPKHTVFFMTMANLPAPDRMYLDGWDRPKKRQESPRTSNFPAGTM
ncbi:hypothetical protein KJ359_002338 [Pestalotiopsis sp. 9143b]|nr:hypothetical protein KJ359_002338 [Pestalotiopsis sp. 9143b]